MDRRSFLSIAGATGISFLSIPPLAVAAESVDEDSAPWVEIEEYSEGEYEEKFGSDTGYEENILVEQVSRGTSLPRADSIYYLKNGSYNYTLADFGYRLFTNTWLYTSSKIIRVTISNWTVLKSYGNAEKNRLTLLLYKGNSVSQRVTKKVNSGKVYVVTFHSLKTNQKYALGFEVPTNGNRYSAKGRITQ